MSQSQLLTVLKVEKEREQAAAMQFQQAQQELNAQKQKLQQLRHYRTDYIEEIKRHGGAGFAATRYQQHLSFVGKLDLACEQQLHVISRALIAADQKKAVWLAKQQRTKAILKLLEKQELATQQKLQKQEQALMDEFSTQHYLRKNRLV